MLQKLPVDLSTLRRIRESKYLYVDKTKYAYEMITNGERYFLSRPRRFGKSLLVSTLKEILEGNKALFDGLWIASSDYHWNPHGVIDLDFSGLSKQSPETFHQSLCYRLRDIAGDYNLDIKTDFNVLEIALHGIVKALYNRFGKVAILIDEYDSPILHSLQDTDSARAVRKIIQGFFAAIKSLDAFVTFVFITGVSSFSKAGLFSGMNNLLDITLENKYASMCGYTAEEVDYYFTDHMEDWSEAAGLTCVDLKAQIKYWYNGYKFSKNASSVYNPFSLMRALAAQEFENFWFLSGTPTFLIEELKQEYRKEEYRIIEPEKFELTKNALGIFDIGAIPLPVLLFQTGYLTIASFDTETKLYALRYPNQEVKEALQRNLLAIFVQLDFIKTERASQRLSAAFNHGNIDEAMDLIKQLFANVPHQLHTKEEKFYHALLQILCDAAGIKSQSEYSTSHGRIDLVLDLPKVLYVIEIKLNSSADVALQQIEERRYYEPFLGYGKPITLLGMSFAREPKHFDVTYIEKKLTE